MKSCDKNAAEKLTYPDKLYTEIFEDTVRQVKSRVDIYCAGVAVTFKQLDDMSNSFANFLKEQGLKPGGVAGVNLPNVLANYISVIGIIKAGCVVSGVSPFLSQRELEFQLNDSGAKGLVTMMSSRPMSDRSWATLVLR